MSRVSLPQVALRAVTSVAIPETVAALRRSIDQVVFGSVELLTDREPSADAHPAIKWTRIEPIKNRQEYSDFILRRLAEHVDLPHVLVIQWDGFVLDGSRWTDAFLSFDYIGAPWPQFSDDHDVGNGGFSLRSRRLLELTAAPDFRRGHPEDVAICRTNRTFLESRGIRFAPAPCASRFAFERRQDAETFGFHGLFNFPTVLRPADLETTLRQLDPGLIATRDGADLIMELARSGKRREAWRLARRRWSHAPWTRANLQLWRRLIMALATTPRDRSSAQAAA